MRDQLQLVGSVLLVVSLAACGQGGGDDCLTTTTQEVVLPTLAERESPPQTTAAYFCVGPFEPRPDGLISECQLVWELAGAPATQVTCSRFPGAVLDEKQPERNDRVRCLITQVAGPDQGAASGWYFDTSSTWASQLGCTPDQTEPGFGVVNLTDDLEAPDVVIPFLECSRCVEADAGAPSDAWASQLAGLSPPLAARTGRFGGAFADLAAWR